MQLNDPVKIDLNACLSVSCPLCGAPRDSNCCDGTIIRPIPHFERRDIYDKQVARAVEAAVFSKLY